MHFLSSFVEDKNDMMSPACLIDASYSSRSYVSYKQERVVWITTVRGWKYCIYVNMLHWLLLEIFSNPVN
jgi:hypothetical protein